MKYILMLLAMCSFTYAVDLYEAEDASLKGTTENTSVDGFSGTGAIKMGANSSNPGHIEFTITADTEGYYELSLTAAPTTGNKAQKLYIDDEFVVQVQFYKNSSYYDEKLGTYKLSAGDHTVKVVEYWGDMIVDKLNVTKIDNYVAIDYSKATDVLINSNADATTKARFAELKENYGKKIISGQTGSHTKFWDQLQLIMGKVPMQRAWDLSSYTEGYPWHWDPAANDGAGGHSLGWEDSKVVEEAIEWFEKTDKKGLVSFQWHWCSPSGGKAGTNTFYSENTTFDVTKVSDNTSDEYKLMVRDIDSIATQLKKTQDAGMPVLFRPLHEAGGQWFWWGAKGAEPCKELWDLVYDRLTNHHGLTNLIWVWSTSEKEWYPGNDKVDIIGYDSYPDHFATSPIKLIFDQLYDITNGEKMIAMTENGPVPSVDRCIEEDAMWLYFSGWGNLAAEQNTKEHLVEVFGHPNVITLGDTELEEMEGEPEGAIIVEAEDADLTDDLDIITSPEGFSGNGAVKMMDSGTLTFEFDVPKDGTYEIYITYLGDAAGDKPQLFSIDGEAHGEITLLKGTLYAREMFGSYAFTKGSHTISISKSWGWVTFDKVSLVYTTDEPSMAVQNLGNSDKCSFYPNPVIDEVTITLTDETISGDIFIVSTTGKVVTVTAAKDILSIDVSSLEKGVYYVVNEDKVIGSFYK